MAEYHRHPDGFVFIRPTPGSSSGAYGDTLANFQADYGQPASALPSGADEQLYTQGVRHAYKAQGMVTGGGPQPWTWGDNAIAALNSLLSAQTARRQGALPISPPP